MSFNPPTSDHSSDPQKTPEVNYESGWIAPAQRPVRPDRIQTFLFVLTCLTTTRAGTQTSLEFYAKYANTQIEWSDLYLLENLLLGLPFSATLLLILGLHEMGHFLAARRWNVRATLPYFIPLPSIIGTMGAVIRIKSRIPNRLALFDIGVSGPLAGFVVSALALAYGFANSEIVKLGHFEGQGALVFGDSLLTTALQYLTVGEIPKDHELMLGPVGLAGWWGLFITMLNLLPVGQLDGGHLAYAFLGKRHEVITKVAIGCLFVLWALGPGYGWILDPAPFRTWLETRWWGWLVWGCISIFLGRRHPPTLDPDATLDTPRKRVGYLTVAVFIVCFIPNPIRWISP